MECNVILTHELEQFDIGLVLPPFLPFVCVVCGDGDVADWRVEPNVEDFVFVSFERNRSSPFQVTRNAPAL